MAVTLMENAITNAGAYSPQEKAVIAMFTQVSPVFERIPMEKIDGRTYVYNREVSLPGIAWRAVNEPWAESTGVINPLVERLMILGGEFKVDVAILNTEPARGPGEWAKQAKMKVRAAANEFDRAFFEGDDLVDPRQMVGLRRRLAGSQVLYFGSSGAGATLTLAQLDQLIDAVPFPNKVLYLNRALRRKITALIQAQTGSARIDYTLNSMGKQVEMYGGAEIAIVEQTGDASTMLDFDEDAGNATANTASIYVCAYGDNLVHGIYNGPGGKTLDVQTFGEKGLEGEPRRLGRLEFYPGMVIEHPRAAARLRGVTNT